jgi:hypothetical protein
MAVFLNNKVGLKINNVDLSDHVTSITLNQAFDELEITSMGDLSHRYVKGLESNTLTVSFLNDQATGEVLATLNSAYGTTVAFKAINDSSAAVSAQNLLFEGDILINNLTPVNGAVGDMSTMDITFTINSDLDRLDTGSF